MLNDQRAASRQRVGKLVASKGNSLRVRGDVGDVYLQATS